MRQRRKPSPNLPNYKKAILEAQAHNISFADFRSIWSLWDEPYCNPDRARVLWVQTRYAKKHNIGGDGYHPPGHLTNPRPKEQLDQIRAAVREGVGFADFWAKAKDWPTRDHREKSRVSLLYKYYKYRLVGQTTTAIETPPPHTSYGKERRLLAVASIAKGIKFAEFWTTQGAAWNVPMFRLRNWYRGLQKQWRDLVAVYPEAATDDLVPALAARAAVHEPRWAEARRRGGE